MEGRAIVVEDAPKSFVADCGTDLKNAAAVAAGMNIVAAYANADRQQIPALHYMAVHQAIITALAGNPDDVLSRGIRAIEL